jgi:hypothetical protein
MSIVILIAIGVALLLVVAFFAVNRWSSPEQDRGKRCASHPPADARTEYGNSRDWYQLNETWPFQDAAPHCLLNQCFP